MDCEYHLRAWFCALAKRFICQVFGATGHMGRSLVRAVLAHGDQCTAVGWTQENTPEQMNKWQDRNCLGLLCDVRVRETVNHVIKKSIEYWGRVDVIANSTGYGVIAACEDQDAYDLRNQFTTNFLGTLHILQLSLPYFRAQNAGRYLIFSSTAGALGVPGLGPYCATKYAVEGLIESMLYEIDAFNIKATLVEPGHVRLDEPDDHVIPPSYTSAPATSRGPPKPKRYGHFFVKPNPSEPYAALTSPAQHARRMVQWLNDRQPVSAVKSAELVWQLGHCSYPPLRLILGSYAVESIRDRLKSITEEIEDWKHLSFPVSMPPEDEGGTGEIKEEPDQEEEQDQD
jgi:NAD(P)-dependent dehydrogenase (short-subunit alcohol dehydrogenase family)